MNDIELKEVNNFLQENPIRNKFLPVLEHISKLKPIKYDIGEYVNKLGNPVVEFTIHSEKERVIDGRVCFDWCGDINPLVKNNVIFELWWDEENYCLLNTPIQAQNMISCLLGKLENKYTDIYRTVKKSEELLPLKQI